MGLRHTLVEEAHMHWRHSSEYPAPDGRGGLESHDVRNDGDIAPSTSAIRRRGRP